MLDAESNSDGDDSEGDPEGAAQHSDEEYLPDEQELDSDAENAGEYNNIEINSESESDSDETENEEEVAPLNDAYYSSKDGTKWYKVRDQICRFSNKKAEDFYRQWNANNPDKKPVTWTPITDNEFKAFLGILLVMGTQKSSQEQLSELWKQNAFPLYRATMSVNRFQQILRFIRFDNHVTRIARQSKDKASPIRDVFEMLNSNLKNNFRPYECITVDEQLFGYRGRTKFTQYIPSKPAKYGIKIWWACDSATSYPLNGKIYTGKEGNCRDVNQGERVVKDLVDPYKNSGRNVTVDNFFTSLPLLQELIKWNMTIVGTLKKNKRYVPEEFKASKNREVFSSEFGFGPSATMTSYVQSKRKAVVLLSSMHRDSVVFDTKQKPEIILYYNKTKGGVDTMDKIVSQYTTKRATTRWPLAMFYNLLDISALAAYIIYVTNNPHRTVKCSRRRVFLSFLGTNLCIPQIKTRAENPMVAGKFYIKTAIECILGEPISAPISEEDFEANGEPQRNATGRIKHKGACYMCYRDSKKKRSTRQECIKCKKPICAEHSLPQTKCQDCYMGTTSEKRSLRA